MKRWYVILIFALAGCQDNEADTPALVTEEAQQIGSTSVVMGAEIKEVGPIRPINFGFLWGTQSDLSIVSGNKVLLGSTSEVRKFSIKQDNLNPSTQYFYRSFAANSDYSVIYYFNVVKFTTLP